MSILTIPQLNFCHVFPCNSVSSTRRLFLAYERCNIASRNVAQVCDEDDSTAEALQVVNKIEEYIGSIRMMLSTIDEGRISVSPYDTAWIALIKVDGRGTPQFPSCLEWIAQHQLPDGSWGDQRYFCAYDRLVNTLACVVALRSWNVHADQSKKGISFIKENVHKLANADAEHMTAGFEVVFPALLQKARDLGIHDLPYDAPVLRDIYSARDHKMKRIPKELMHKVPTALLYSLEGLEDLEWQKLLKLQSPHGSFLTSPSSTAFAFMQTGDQNCLKFIKYTLQKCNGGAPHVFPVDIFARLWAVDRLQRLGISRFFQSEIKDCLSHVYRFWSEKGVFSGRYSEFSDIDDTSMGFRLLRLHGYDVDPNVLSNFKDDDKFSCYAGQMIESATPIYNLYRASQVRFPGEKILEEANTFAYKFLQEKLDSHQLLDKWVISKHLPDEIRIGLMTPWYASLPRIETRFYLQHYAGGDEVWIGKTFYRMEDISNDSYLELARLDFNRCQAQHQTEWNSMQQWYENFNVYEFGVSRKDVLLAYFLGSASMFEADRSKERMAWAKSRIISRMITSFFNDETTSSEQKAALLTGLRKDISAHTDKKVVRENNDKSTFCWHHSTNSWRDSIHIHVLETNGSWDTTDCSIKDMEIEQDMQALVKLVLEESVGGIDRNLKQTFLSVAKTFYYRAYTAPETIDMHIFKVLFEPVV
ncbi:UNVERIFIED_CONTAM: Peregrinol diphosphate synthase TPS1, chloroplastic [Sesamum radiatum]|uniref:Peregrinol diphosphate synthase TPS1, chloroplastic n=1 Tax=Sesamum radiatum TaxID=300843 RepID=A0AAW2L1Q5_SESRA